MIIPGFPSSRYTREGLKREYLTIFNANTYIDS